MNQIGFTDFGYNVLIGQARIKRFIEMGAEYLIINDKSHYDNEFLKPFITKKTGSYRNIDVYSLKKW